MSDDNYRVETLNMVDGTTQYRVESKPYEGVKAGVIFDQNDEVTHMYLKPSTFNLEMLHELIGCLTRIAAEVERRQAK